MANENIFLLYALLMGIFITFVYDILRIVRRVIPHGNWLISLEDMVFWIYCSVKVFLLMYHESNGTLRWFAVLGAMVGMVLYKMLISPLFVKYASLLLKTVLGALAKVVKFLFKPIGAVRKKAKKAVDKGKVRAFRRRERMKWLVKKKLTFLGKMLK